MRDILTCAKKTNHKGIEWDPKSSEIFDGFLMLFLDVLDKSEILFFQKYVQIFSKYFQSFLKEARSPRCLEIVNIFHKIEK